VGGAGRPCGQTLEVRGSGLMVRPINRTDQGQGRPNWRGAPVWVKKVAHPSLSSSPLKLFALRGFFNT